MIHAEPSDVIGGKRLAREPSLRVPKRPETVDVADRSAAGHIWSHFKISEFT